MREKIEATKKEQGVTLVALVVTIIILLILAGAAINMALGDNGLFHKAKEAVNAWKLAEEKESAEIEHLYNLLSEGSIANLPTDPESPTPQEPVLIGTTVDDIVLPANSEEATTVTIGEEEVTIPPKFTIAADSGKTVLEGIAVVDSQENE